MSLREKYYICPQNLKPWRRKWPWFRAWWCSFCCSVRAPRRSRRGPFGKPKGRWKRWKSDRRNSMSRPSRHTTSIRQKRPNKWSKKTNDTPKGCVGDNGAIRFSPDSILFSPDSIQKFQFFDLIFDGNRKKPKKSVKNRFAINDYISKCCIGFQVFLEEKNAENEFFSCVLSKKVVILTTFNALNKVVLHKITRYV